MFAEALSDEGFSVWWDASLHSGETFDEIIEQQLRDAKAVVVLWSPRSVASRWVRAEATQADRRNKLVPAMIEHCDRPVIFELTHTADLCDWTGDLGDIHWRAFIDDLRRHAGGAEADIPAARRPAARPKSSPAVRQPLRPGSHEVIHAAAHARGRPQAPVAEAAAEIHCLELDEEGLGEKRIVIDRSGMKVGRSAPAEIVLPHSSVSREHCVIGLANDELVVSDLNSTNGTYIDGARISRATILPPGSVLRVGQVSLRHEVRSGVEAAPGGQLQPGRLAAAS
jgi:hypothetical protein